MQTEEKITCFVKDPAKNKMVPAGYVQGKTYYRSVKPHHVVDNMGDAYGMQNTLLDQFKGYGIETVVLTDKTAKVKYTSDLGQWFEPQIKSRDFGHGPQTFLPRRYMKAEKI